jgi:hypothetical protein
MKTVASSALVELCSLLARLNALRALRALRDNPPNPLSLDHSAVVLHGQLIVQDLGDSPKGAWVPLLLLLPLLFAALALLRFLLSVALLVNSSRPVALRA